MSYSPAGERREQPVLTWGRAY